MDTLPPKPNLVENGEMPDTIAKKVIILAERRDPFLYSALSEIGLYQHGLSLKAMDPQVVRSLELTLLDQNRLPKIKYAQPMVILLLFNVKYCESTLSSDNPTRNRLDVRPVSWLER